MVDLRCPAGGDLPAGEPEATDQEQLHGGLPHWLQLRRVLPPGPLRPWLRDGRAQRGTAGDGVALSKRQRRRVATTGNRAINCNYAANAGLSAIGTLIGRHRPHGRLTQPNSTPDVLHAVQCAQLPHALTAYLHKDEVKASRTADVYFVKESMLSRT